MPMTAILAIFLGLTEANKLKFGNSGSVKSESLEHISTNGNRVAVFVQAANPSLWGEMQSCVENVADAHMGPLDVLVSAIGGEAGEAFRSSLARSKHLNQRAGGTKVQVDVVENRGADIGQFLQQLQNLTEVPPTTPYDMVLKIHTKSDPKLRHWSLDSLCGSPSTVRHVMTRFARDTSLAMVGGKYMVLNWPFFDHHWVSGGAWHNTEIAAMRKAWPKISEGPMPSVFNFTIVANSFYWVRGDQLLRGDLLHAIPALLASMPLGYKTGSSAQTSHALERLIPTMIRSRGLKVEEA
eukprot:TRINITY_DN8358_c0_g3_i1.p1 TRINITY_DN8358_c0_g3~~TRINITY_DN8358_c0_g3_i1.p1  ORF type:complete len:296 (-),score=38.36 TRINITY_DN8358_c0_g3_i1:146-1033(-)